MKAIKIVGTPPGFAPKEIRDAWVGLEIPLATPQEMKENPPSGVRLGSENINGYHVLLTEAIIALQRAGKSEAAEFWQEIPLGTYLQFRKDVCQVIN